MREFITLVEAAESVGILRKNIIDLINATEDDILLKRVLKVLDSGDLDRRVAEVLATDDDAKKFIQTIVRAYMDIEAPKEEKESFLRQYPKGVLNVDLLVDGSKHSFKELLGSDFAVELFRQLCVELKDVGVGAGEKALAIMSPRVQWSGRKSGGGDVIVDGRPVEVKATVSSGGRWIDAVKFDMDLSGIKDVILNAIPPKSGLDIDPNTVSVIGIKTWVNTIRPAINPQRLNHVAKYVADLTFKHTDNEQYQQALASGSEADIKEAIMHVGYNNYRAAAKFEGMLLMDIPHGNTHYFEDYKDIRDHIKVDTAYIYSSDPRQMMPKTSLQRIKHGGQKQIHTAPASAPRPERAPAVPNKLASPEPAPAAPPSTEPIQPSPV